ncbi:hypothetical protein VTN96DRAFT_130 [Rasamsonia emersonii]
MGSTIGGEESRVRSEDVDRDSFSYRNWARKHLYWYMKDVQPLFKQRAKKLKKKGGSEGLLSREKDSLSPKFNGPSAIFCFDEARELLNNPTEIEESDMMFLALRRALRQQTKSAKNQDEKEFFAVLLDTSSKVNAFSPQKELDPSAKWTESDRLFTPIYKIDSMDVFARDTVDGVPKVALKPILKDGDLKSLFSLGRPLWGAMAERMEINDLVDFALSKAYGGIPGGDTIDDVVGLALLSYRLFFYVVSPWLAEKLSSGYLRYIHGISDDWKLLRTVQPSEPILAHISSCETKSPLKRQRLIEALYSNIMQGTIHLGDIGEMVACLVFLFTFDKAATTDLPGPIKFSTFFESLVSHDVFADFKIRMEDDSNMKTILDDGHIFFNHFIRATEEITPETLTLVWRCGAGIIAPTGWKGGDLSFLSRYPDAIPCRLSWFR